MATDSRHLRFVLGSLKGRFVYLFLSLFLFLVLYPYIDDSQTGNLLILFLYVAIPVTGVYAVSWSRAGLFIGICLGAILVLAAVGRLAGIDLISTKVSTLFGFIFYAYTTFSILGYILQRTNITSDTLYGAVCVYLMLGMSWMQLYRFIEVVHPGSFAGAAEWPDFLYYSFVTLTTLGYGEITPVTQQAQSLAILEAATGTLYVAILVARLVGIYTSQSMTPQK
jgi:hypothetical protein